MTNASVRNLTVTQDMTGQRLDNFLITELKGVPKSHIYRIIRKGEVRINKGRIKPDYRLIAGDIIRIPPIRLSEGTQTPQIPAKINETLLTQILYEDEGLIVLNKPSGMAVHGGSGLSFGVIEALRLLKPKLKNLELVHRLDRETSGCLMIAKRRSTLKVLHEYLRTGQVEKNYLALVKGKWRGGSLVDVPLQKNQLQSGERMVRVSDQGLNSQTEFQILQEYKEATLMLARPITGRTHQIRVHAQYVGHPIALDSKYGEEDFNRFMKQLGLKRLFLHAKSISIPPLDSSSTPLTIEAPLEFSLTQVLDRLATKENRAKNGNGTGESPHV